MGPSPGRPAPPGLPRPRHRRGRRDGAAAHRPGRWTWRSSATPGGRPRWPWMRTTGSAFCVSFAMPATAGCGSCPRGSSTRARTPCHRSTGAHRRGRGGGRHLAAPGADVQFPRGLHRGHPSLPGPGPDRRASAHEGDEIIEIHWLPLDQALAWCLDGTIIDAKTLIGLFRAAASLGHDWPRPGPG